MRKLATLLVLLATATALAENDPLTDPQGFFSLSAQTPAASAPAAPQNFFDKWEARASATQALQPKWMVPVVSPYPMLIQVFRSDFSRQISPTHVTTWNLGTTRGLNLIPCARTEFDILVPPYLLHSDKTPDGFGDIVFSGKYRILSGNEKSGNYLLSFSTNLSVPTGSYKNGATNSIFTPVLSGGKGFGRFDAIVTVGGTLPTGNTFNIGRTITANETLQYHVGKYLWPELEFNTTSWYGSTKDGKIQTFVTPGLAFGKIPFFPKEPKRRPGFAGGIGFQISATHYHTYNHNLVYTLRYLF